MSLEVAPLAGTPAEMEGRHGEFLAEGARASCESRVELRLRAGQGKAREGLAAPAAEPLPVERRDSLWSGPGPRVVAAPTAH